MDMTTFFAYARRAPFGGRFSQSQIDGINRLLAQWRYYKLTDLRELAYILATVFHETGGRMLPVREAFASSDASAIKMLDKAFAAGRLGSVRKPYWRKDAAGKSWFGRGDVQITHQENYRTMGDRLGVDLVGNPSLALDPVISARIAIVGMQEGLFTGRKLTDYFGHGKDDPTGARAIVNGEDKAKLIAGYYKNFLDALEAAYAARKTGAPADVRPKDAEADDMPASQSKSIWTLAGSLVASGGLGVAKQVMDSGASLLSAVSNPWSFASLAFAVAAIGVFAWLFASGRLTLSRG